MNLKVLTLLLNITMAFDIEMIKKVYANMPARIEAALFFRKTLGRPLTLAEKILYSHLDAGYGN
jgi:aconitate hydratase